MRWERQKPGEPYEHQVRGHRRRDGKLELRFVLCPNCGHHKLFYHTSPNSFVRRHCNMCGYMEPK